MLEASEGDEALRFVEAYSGQAINLLLTDVVLPQLGGRSLAAYVAACYRGPVTSGYAEHGIVHHGQLDQSADV